MQVYYGDARAPGQSRRITLLPTASDYVNVINTLRLQLAINALSEQNKTLTLRVAQLEEAAQATRSASEVAEYEELRDVSVARAATEIHELFKARPGRDIYYSDLAQELRIDIATIIEACNALVADGVIEAANG
jgi:hypothetical protein